MPKTITKKDLVINVSKRTDISQHKVKGVIDSFLEDLKKNYRDGSRVELRNFGVFYPHLRKSRIYKNPKTNESNSSMATIVLKFKPSKHLRHII